MTLKDKFEAYRSEPDPIAWEHFLSLQKNKKRKGFLFWFWTIGLIIVGGSAMATWSFYSEPSSNISFSPVLETEIRNDKKVATAKNDRNVLDLLSDNSNEIEKAGTINEFSPNELNPEVTSGSKSSKEKFVATEEHDVKLVNSIVLTERMAKQSNSSELTAIKNLGIQKLEGNDVEIKNEEKSTSLLIIENGGGQNFVNKNKKVENKIVLQKDFLSFIDLLDIQPFLILLPERPEAISTIIEPVMPQIKRSYIFFSAGHADGFINGFSLDNPVRKQGIGLHLSYIHDWSKIIGMGVSLGYVNAIDQANDQFMIKDQETIKYIHAKLYLNLVYEARHQLRLNVGIGPTITDRVLGTFFIDTIQGITERRFQINTLSSIGISAGAQYNYHLTENIGIGVFGNIISHNDGGWDAGFAVGYNF